MDFDYDAAIIRINKGWDSEKYEPSSDTEKDFEIVYEEWKRMIRTESRLEPFITMDDNGDIEFAEWELYGGNIPSFGILVKGSCKVVTLDNETIGFGYNVTAMDILVMHNCHVFYYESTKIRIYGYKVFYPDDKSDDALRYRSNLYDEPILVLWTNS